VQTSFLLHALFQPEQPEKKRHKDDDVEDLFLPFLAFQQVPDDEKGDESGEDIIEDGHDHEIKTSCVVFGSVCLGVVKTFI
jgi:hypothetical protein